MMSPIRQTVNYCWGVKYNPHNVILPLLYTHSDMIKLEIVFNYVQMFLN